MPATHTWKPTRWVREKDWNEYNPSAIVIELANSPFYKGERYAVRDAPFCLNKNGQWEYEPMPSSRDDAFYERCRFDSFVDAMDMLEKAGEMRKRG